MLALPPVAPATGWRRQPRLPRDHYVRLDGNDYSVHPAAIGRRVEVVADLDRVRVSCDGTRRRRPRPVLGPAPDHHRPRPRRGRDACCAAARHRVLAARARDSRREVEQRPLADYDPPSAHRRPDRRRARWQR